MLPLRKKGKRKAKILRIVILSYIENGKRKEITRIKEKKKIEIEIRKKKQKYQNFYEQRYK